MKVLKNGTSRIRSHKALLVVMAVLGLFSLIGCKNPIEEALDKVTEEIEEAAQDKVDDATSDSSTGTAT